MAVLSTLAPTHTRWTICIDGTHGDRNIQKASTVVGDLGWLLSKRQQIIWYREGLGASTTFVNYVLGGAIGFGIHDQIKKAFGFLIENWNEGDEIVIIGYSRGAHAGIRLAELISSVGLPRENPGNSARELYHRFEKGELELDEARWRAIRDFKCQENVPIKALALFDTVPTLGIPKTGILRLLSWIPSPNKKALQVANLNKVENIFQALASHEIRGPYVPTLIHLPVTSKTKLEQVWFTGTHHDLGKEQRHENGGLIDFPLAWMIDRLASVGVDCNQARLEHRFPGYHRTDAAGSSTGSDDGAAPPKHLKDWTAGKVHRTYKGLMMLMGHEARRPGRTIPAPATGAGALVGATMTNERVHISMRIRGHGLTENSATLPGLRYVRSPDETIRWTSCGTWSSDDSNSVPVVLDEAPFGSLEAELHNISLL